MTLVIATMATISVIVASTYGLVNTVVRFTADVMWNALAIFCIQNAIRTFAVTFAFAC